MERILKYSKVVRGKHLINYFIRVSDEMEGGCYRQITMLEGFASRMLNRWYNVHRNGEYTVFGRKHETDDSWLRTNKTIKGAGYTVETKHFDSVWAFFEYIKFPYKNRRIKELDNQILNWVDE